MAANGVERVDLEELDLVPRMLGMRMEEQGEEVEENVEMIEEMTEASEEGVDGVDHLVLNQILVATMVVLQAVALIGGATEQNQKVNNQKVTLDEWGFLL